MITTIGKIRLKAVLLDVVFSIIATLFISYVTINILNTTFPSNSFVIFFEVVALIIFILKDIVSGRSLGKRIYKLRVVNENGSSPNFFKLILRNLYLVFFPVEIYLLLHDLERRKGDRKYETKVIKV